MPWHSNHIRHSRNSSIHSVYIFFFPPPYRERGLHPCHNHTCKCLHRGESNCATHCNSYQILNLRYNSIHNSRISWPNIQLYPFLQLRWIGLQLSTQGLLDFCQLAPRHRNSNTLFCQRLQHSNIVQVKFYQWHSKRQCLNCHCAVLANHHTTTCNQRQRVRLYHSGIWVSCQSELESFNILLMLEWVEPNGKLHKLICRPIRRCTQR